MVSAVTGNAAPVANTQGTPDKGASGSAADEFRSALQKARTQQNGSNAKGAEPKSSSNPAAKSNTSSGDTKVTANQNPAAASNPSKGSQDTAAKKAGSTVEADDAGSSEQDVDQNGSDTEQDGADEGKRKPRPALMNAKAQNRTSYGLEQPGLRDNGIKNIPVLEKADMVQLSKEQSATLDRQLTRPSVLVTGSKTATPMKVTSLDAGPMGQMERVALTMPAKATASGKSPGEAALTKTIEPRLSNLKRQHLEAESRKDGFDRAKSEAAFDAKVKAGLERYGSTIDRVNADGVKTFDQLKAAIGGDETVVSKADLKDNRGNVLAGYASGKGITLSASLEGVALRTTATEELAERFFQSTFGKFSAGDFGQEVAKRVDGTLKAGEARELRDVTSSGDVTRVKGEGRVEASSAGQPAEAASQPGQRNARARFTKDYFNNKKDQADNFLRKHDILEGNRLKQNKFIAMDIFLKIQKKRNGGERPLESTWDRINYQNIQRALLQNFTNAGPAARFAANDLGKQFDKIDKDSGPNKGTVSHATALSFLREFVNDFADGYMQGGAKLKTDVPGYASSIFKRGLTKRFENSGGRLERSIQETVRVFMGSRDNNSNFNKTISKFLNAQNQEHGRGGAGQRIQYLGKEFEKLMERQALKFQSGGGYIQVKGSEKDIVASLLTANGHRWDNIKGTFVSMVADRHKAAARKLINQLQNENLNANDNRAEFLSNRPTNFEILQTAVLDKRITLADNGSPVPDSNGTPPSDPPQSPDSDIEAASSAIDEVRQAANAIIVAMDDLENRAGEVTPEQLEDVTGALGVLGQQQEEAYEAIRQTNFNFPELRNPLAEANRILQDVNRRVRNYVRDTFESIRNNRPAVVRINRGLQNLIGGTVIFTGVWGMIQDEAFNPNVPAAERAFRVIRQLATILLGGAITAQNRVQEYLDNMPNQERAELEGMLAGGSGVGSNSNVNGSNYSDTVDSLRQSIIEADDVHFSMRKYMFRNNIDFKENSSETIFFTGESYDDWDGRIDNLYSEIKRNNSDVEYHLSMGENLDGGSDYAAIYALKRLIPRIGNNDLDTRQYYEYELTENLENHIENNS